MPYARATQHSRIIAAMRLANLLPLCPIRHRHDDGSSPLLCEHAGVVKEVRSIRCVTSGNVHDAHRREKPRGSCRYYTGDATMSGAGSSTPPLRKIPIFSPAM